jgi:UPF0176 protein
MTVLHVSAFYVFAPLPAEGLPALRAELQAFGTERAMQGLVLVAPEGLNGTVGGDAASLAAWKAMLEARFGMVRWNDTETAQPIFRRFRVKVKREIVSLRQPDVAPAGPHRHLTPEQWEEMARGDVTILDTRNAYETRIGAFQGAVDPGIKAFHEFPEYVRTAGPPKDKPVLMYCTGGIRCEKALLEMEKQGYQDVYQLEGGILAYLRRFPQGRFKGECFVFDARVAVDADLQPSARYVFCPHCGDAGDTQVLCAVCGEACNHCAMCAAQPDRRACSKRCQGVLLGRMPANAVPSRA